MLRSTRFRLSARRPSSIACRRHLLLEPIERRILFATFTVTSLDNTGPGTLREAIGFANDEINFPGLDTINFGVSGTITLASELAISSHGLLGCADPQMNSSTPSFLRARSSHEMCGLDSSGATCTSP